MEKGYRVPKIEELVKGFRYEWQSPRSGNWIPDYVVGEVTEGMRKYHLSCISRKVIRVKL